MSIDINEIKVGSFVHTHADWHQVMYKYGNDKMVSALGLGKPDSYPVLLEEIDCVCHGRSVVEVLQGNDVLSWYDNKTGSIFLSIPATADSGPQIFHVGMLLSGGFFIVKACDFGFLYQVTDKTLFARTSSDVTVKQAAIDVITHLSQDKYWEKDEAGTVFVPGESRLYSFTDIYQENQLSREDLNLRDIDMSDGIYVEMPSLLRPLA